MFYRKDNTQDNRQRILEILKKEELISGEAISKSLGISRNAVWKQVQNLKDLGYEISAETKLGYRLTGVPDFLYPFEIWPHLKTKKFGQAIYWDYKLTSTNDKARELARQNALEGTLVLAETQSKGRGRRGRTWESPPAQGGIYMSLILKPLSPLAKASPYTFLGAYAVSRFCLLRGLFTKVKWPNDVYVNGKKISGILTELSATGQDIGYLVLGIGINVNQAEFPPDICATSLLLETNKTWSRKEVLAELLLYLEEGYQRLSQDTTWLIELMKKHSLLLGKEIVVTGGLELEGVAEDIAPDGALLVRVADKAEPVKVWAGDVSVREKKKA